MHSGCDGGKAAAGGRWIEGGEEGRESRISRLFPLLETWPQKPPARSLASHQQYFVCSVCSRRELAIRVSYTTRRQGGENDRRGVRQDPGRAAGFWMRYGTAGAPMRHNQAMRHTVGDPHAHPRVVLSPGFLQLSLARSHSDLLAAAQPPPQRGEWEE